MAIRIVAMLLLVPLLLVLIRVLPHLFLFVAPLAFPVLLLGGIASAVAVAWVARSPRAGRPMARAALWVVLAGTTAAVALVTIDVWYNLVVPRPTVIVDSLPGYGAYLTIATTIASVAAIGLVLGWGLWDYAGSRESPPDG
jgi:hypothetical protein